MGSFCAGLHRIPGKIGVVVVDSESLRGWEPKADQSPGYLPELRRAGLVVCLRGIDNPALPGVCWPNGHLYRKWEGPAHLAFLAGAAAAAGNSREGTGREMPKQRVVVADNVEVDAKKAARYLQSGGMVVETCTGRDELLRMVAEKQFDAALVDVYWEHGDKVGRRYLADVQERSVHKPLAILLFTNKVVGSSSMVELINEETGYLPIRKWDRPETWAALIQKAIDDANAAETTVVIEEDEDRHRVPADDDGVVTKRAPVGLWRRLRDWWQERR